MDQLPKHASVVVIGAGVMGNCMARHLALAGWKDIVLLDKGPLPNPGGSPAMPRTSSSLSTTRRR